MRPIKSALSILSISPVLHFQCSACRNPLLLAQLDLRQQCPAPQSLQSDSTPTAPRRYSTTPQARLTQSQRNSFSYRVAASYVAKGKKFRVVNDSYSFNVANRTEIFTGRPFSGQDAFFIAGFDGRYKSAGMAFGVADGVGGWADSGIDSADFSHGLCKMMAQKTKEGNKDERLDPESIGPKQLLNRSYTAVVEAGQIAGGGSTACVAVGKQDGNLTVANLGDSGFVQIRPGAIHHNSNPQTHAFNTPYQLSIVPPRVLALSRAFGGGPLSDLPDAADVSTHTVRHGDVLVFATDGVWDNISPAEVLGVVTRMMREGKGWKRRESDHAKGIGTKDVEIVAVSAHQLDRVTRPPANEAEAEAEALEEDDDDDGDRKEGDVEAEINRAKPKPDPTPRRSRLTDSPDLQTTLAVAIAQEAKAASMNTKRDGPFAREVQRYYPHEDFHGGKVDDICVVVAIVVADDPQQRKRESPS